MFCICRRYEQIAASNIATRDAFWTFDASSDSSLNGSSFLHYRQSFYLVSSASGARNSASTMSSPGPYDLPPSSAPIDPTTPQSSLSQSLGQSRVFDPLAFDNVPGLNGTLPGGGRGDEAIEDTETGNPVRRGGMRRRFEDTADIPRVRDPTGEGLMASFAKFLEE